MSLLTDKNSKLGPDILAWSLPAISTCPGASAACRDVCYAAAGHYNWESVKNGLRRRKRAADGSRFADRMIKEIGQSGKSVIRIHASGDVYSVEYAEAWLTIAKSCPEKTFFAYTRSWSDPGIFEVLRLWSRLPNMRLWFSCDKETGAPPRVRGVRRAYMSLSDDDKPVFPVELVFRVSRETAMKFYPAGQLVCPAEQGVERSAKMTCSTCRLCFSGAKIPVKPR